MNFRDRYMQYIIQVVLNLQEGESLSINANTSHVEFAKDLAQEASEITLQPVYIVPIKAGIPGDALTITPLLQEQAALPPSSAVLLRIDNTEDREWEIEEDPATVAENLALLQKAGNLAPPQLDREVAPWAVIPVPGPRWAKRILGKNATEDDLWKFFDKTLQLSSKDLRQVGKKRASTISQQLLFLNQFEDKTLHITDTHTDITISMNADSRWRSGIYKLPNGRAFTPYIPLARVSMLPDLDSISGTITSSQPFSVLGGKVEQATFTFLHGELIKYEAKVGQELLEIALAIDKGACRLSEISLVDARLAFPQITDCYGYRGFDENTTSTFLLGMGEASHIEALSEYADEQELMEKTGCNVSTVRIRIPFGTPNLQITAQSQDGFVQLLMQSGAFIE